MPNVLKKPLVVTDPAQARRVKAVLDATRASCDVGARRERDPVGLVRPFTHRDDRELVGLLASSLAFGNVTTILAKVREQMQGLQNASQEDRQAKLREIMQSSRTEIRAVLTPEQAKKYDEMAAQGRGQGGGGRKKNQ